MKYVPMSVVIFLMLLLFSDLIRFILTSSVNTYPEAPEFSTFTAGDERKTAFFDYFVPLVEKHNKNILTQREILISAYSDKESLTSRDHNNLLKLARQYDVNPFEVDNDSHWQTLLRRVDIIPPSLAVAQAANESAWGTSRFATQANNYFGHWCFVKGCGVVPKNRSAGKRHEVAAFDSAAESVRKYMLNLNTHGAYKDLRVIRAKQREQNKEISGLILLPALLKYSERGIDYVNELREMIHYNELAVLDNDQYQSDIVE